MTSEEYWRAKSIILECELMQTRATNMMTSAQERRTKLLKELELDPTGVYQMDDSKLTIEMVEAKNAKNS